MLLVSVMPGSQVESAPHPDGHALIESFAFRQVPGRSWKCECGQPIGAQPEFDRLGAREAHREHQAEVARVTPRTGPPPGPAQASHQHTNGSPPSASNVPSSGNEGDGSFSLGSPTWPGLAKLVEEAGELLQVAGKLIAAHGRLDHWDGSNLLERLIDELGDLQGAIDFVTTMNLTTDEQTRVSDRASAKRDQFVEWHCEQDVNL